MRTYLVTAFMVALIGPACSGGQGPTTIELPIASLTITNKSSCGAVVEGGSCDFEVRAMTAQGQQISNPIVRWSSSNSSVADVNSESGFVRARTGGDVTIRVSNTTDTASDQALVHVLPSNPK